MPSTPCASPYPPGHLHSCHLCLWRPHCLSPSLLLQDVLGLLPAGSPLNSSVSSSITSSLAATPPSPAGPSSAPGMNANALPFYPTSDTVESVIGNVATGQA